MARRATIDISELGEFFDELEDWFQMVMFDVNNETAKTGKKTAIRMARRDMPSMGGSYAKAFEVENKGRQGNSYIAILRNTHPFATHVEMGTAPHKIPTEPSDRIMTASPMLESPRGKGRPMGMRYGSTVVRGRQFMHPGARAFKILKRTTLELQGKIPGIFDKVVERELT